LSDLISEYTKSTGAGAWVISGMARAHYQKDDEQRGAKLQGTAKDAGEVDYDASVDMVLHTEGEKATLNIAKNRFGKEGTVGLRFEGAIGTFTADPLSALSNLERRILSAVKHGAHSANAVFDAVGGKRCAVLSAINNLVYGGMLNRSPLKLSGYAIDFSDEDEF